MPGRVGKAFNNGNAASYLWQPASGLDNANSKDPVASPVITIDYTVTATSGSCTQKDTVRIVVQRLSVSVTPDTTVMPGMPFQLMAYFAQVTNCYKYAFEGMESGYIHISAQIKSGKALEIIVQDNGVGFEVEKIKTSYGMKLIRGLSNELNGRFSFDNIGGTRFTLELPA